MLVGESFDVVPGGEVGRRVRGSQGGEDRRGRKTRQPVPYGALPQTVAWVRRAMVGMWLRVRFITARGTGERSGSVVRRSLGTNGRVGGVAVSLTVADRGVDATSDPCGARH